MLNFFDKLSPVQFALVLTLPSVLVLFVIISYPFGVLVLNSVSSFDMQLNRTFSGLENYREMFTDPLFWQDLGRSFLYTGGSAIVFTIIGLAVALSLHKIKHFRGFLRGVSLLPWAIPPVTAAMMWRWSFNTEFGMINDILSRIGLIENSIPWLSQGLTSMSVLIFGDAWIRIPFVAILLHAGLQTIPQEQYESAAIDGAGILSRFRYVTLPNLRYPASIALSLQTMFAFRMYAVLSVLTGGGPGRSTELLVKYVYDSAFRDYAFGIASAGSMIMLIFCLSFVVVYWKAFSLEV